jgi:hypothetical protein
VSNSTSSKVLSIGGTAVKLLAILAGGAVTVLCLMSVAGALIANGWARLGIALVVAIGVPAVITDRLLPEDATRGKGIASDVFALAWLGFAFVFVGLAISFTRPLLHTEAGRQAGAGMDTLARVTFWMAGAPERAAQTPDRPPATTADKAADKVADTVAAAPNPGKAAGGEAGEKAPLDKDEAGKAAGDEAGKDGDSAAGKGEQAGKDRPRTGQEISPAELFKTWAPSVVTIAVQKGLVGEGGGTGFFIGSDGTLVTNHHVIDSVDDVRVKLMDGSWAEEVELLTQDADADIAILRISPAPAVDPVVLGDSDKVEVGERAISIGNPLGLEHTLTDGLISARRTLRGRRMIQMSTPISPGNSGGPLFNLRGEVIGVSTATMSGGFGGGQNLNLAMPINTVKEMIKDDYPARKRVGGGNPGAGRW